jgi:hypothetical protein
LYREAICLPLTFDSANIGDPRRQLVDSDRLFFYQETGSVDVKTLFKDLAPELRKRSVESFLLLGHSLESLFVGHNATPPTTL